jgi:HEAT repeat protein
LFALGQLDDPIAFAALEQSLADGDDGVREYAVQSLRGQSTPEATLALTRALQDASPAIRILALEALASRGADGREYVRSALQSGDPLLRARAAELLDQASTNEGNEQ